MHSESVVVPKSIAQYLFQESSTVVSPRSRPGIMDTLVKGSLDPHNHTNLSAKHGAFHKINHVLVSGGLGCSRLQVRVDDTTQVLIARLDGEFEKCNLPRVGTLHQTVGDEVVPIPVSVFNSEACKFIGGWKVIPNFGRNFGMNGSMI
jgi:hypothetical protein